MPRTTLVAGTTITASWANANVRDQVITPFASASARDSAITAPIEGQYAHLTDTNLLTHYNGTVWVPTNNNLITFQEFTTDSSTFTGDGNSDFVLSSVPVFATRNYRVFLKSQWLLSTGPATWVINFSVDGTQTDRFGFAEVAAGPTNGHIDSSILWQPTSGTKTLRVVLDEASGTGDFTFKADNTAGGIFKRQFILEDIGPR